MSYVNTRLRFVFVHVPRTGGTSMLTAPFLAGDDQGHRTYRELTADPDFEPTMFSFTFVRNPFDRLVSAYFHVVECHGFDRYGCFGEFVRRDFGDPRSGYRYANTKLLAHRGGHRHFLPMWELVRDADGRMPLDFVGRFERLATDWPAVCRTLGVPAFELPLENVSGSWGGARRAADWREHYDEESAAIVREVYRDDFERFGYSPEIA